MSELKRYVVRESIANQGFSIRDNTELHPHTIMPPDDVCALLNDLTEKVARLEAKLQLSKNRNRETLRSLADKYPQTIDELISYHDLMAISCINEETKASDRILGISLCTAKTLEELKAECERLRQDAARYRLKFSDDNVWLCVDAPSGLKAMVIVHRPLSTTIAGRAIAECLTIDGQLTKEQP